MKSEITEMVRHVRPKREVSERNFSLNVLNGGLKGKRIYIRDATIIWDKLKQMVKSKLRSMGLSSEISVEIFWGNCRIACELDFFEMWSDAVEDKDGFVTLDVYIFGGDDMAVSIRGISIENLDDSVLENILFRLPLGTSSSRAKRVCKLWKRIMSNRRHNEVGYLFTCGVYKDDCKIQLCFGEEYDHIDCNRMSDYYSHETLMVMEHCRFVYKPFPRDILVGSCNGLVCFQKEDPRDQYVQEPFAICNPLTGEFIFLKANLRADWNTTRECRAVVVSNGFGYCHSTGEYKVVRLYSISEERYASYAQVYTIGSNKWRDVDVLINGTLFCDSGPGIFANGLLHWLGNEREAGCNRIVVFDLEDEKFRELPLPPLEAYEDDYSKPEYELKLLGGNLCWFRRTWYRIDIWAYKKNISNNKITGYGTEENDQKCNYYSTNSWNWVKDFSIEYGSGYECSGSYDHPFALTKNNQVLVLGPSLLYCYDPETRTICSRKDMGMMQVIPHANSYVSLKDFGETWYGPGTGCSAVPRQVGMFR